MYQRDKVALIKQRLLEEDNPLIQVVVGPRQTGKSTMIAQALDEINGHDGGGAQNGRIGRTDRDDKNKGKGKDTPVHSVSADDVLSPDANWIQTEWQQARNLQARSGTATILVIGEIQKVKAWPNTVKGLWDADRREQTPLKVCLSGSSSMLIRKGLEDSLKGRFELIRSPHWTLTECREAFGFTLDDFLFFGGFPGAARFVNNERRWRDYVRDSIIEPTITNDVLEQEEVRKPALMRALLELGTQFSAQELSYTKMLGQLQDAGNTTTLAHYLDLLDKAGMLCALDKYDPKLIRSRKSSPRLMVYDTALMTAMSGRSRELLLNDSELKGYLVESAIGAYLLALSSEHGFSVQWWREGNYEVDFVLSDRAHLVALEVKSGRMKAQGGMAEFLKRYPKAQRMIVGGSAPGSCSVEDFLLGQSSLPWLEE